MNDKNKNKQVEPIPDEFSSYEEAADFWDAHDTIDYLDQMETVPVDAELRQRHHEVELDEDVVKLLRIKAQKLGTTPGNLASRLLRQHMASAG